MVVTTQYLGRRVAGIHIGTSNVESYFAREQTLIELQLDHLQILCRLNDQFWNEQPEILDSRLGDWLRSKHLFDKSYLTPIPVELIPLGENSFRLKALPAVAIKPAQAAPKRATA